MAKITFNQGGAAERCSSSVSWHRGPNIWVSAFVLGALLTGYSAHSFQIESYDAPEVHPVGWVNGQEIPLERFNLLLTERFKRMRLEDGHVPNTLALRVKLDLANQLINERCVELAAEEHNILVTREDIDIAQSALANQSSDPNDNVQLLNSFGGGADELEHQLKLQVMRDRLLANWLFAGTGEWADTRDVPVRDHRRKMEPQKRKIESPDPDETQRVDGSCLEFVNQPQKTPPVSSSNAANYSLHAPQLAGNQKHSDVPEQPGSQVVQRCPASPSLAYSQQLMNLERALRERYSAYNELAIRYHDLLGAYGESAHAAMPLVPQVLPARADCLVHSSNGSHR